MSVRFLARTFPGAPCTARFRFGVEVRRSGAGQRVVSGLHRLPGGLGRDARDMLNKVVAATGDVAKKFSHGNPFGWEWRVVVSAVCLGAGYETKYSRIPRAEAEACPVCRVR